jgi:hypothetical protein
MKQGRRVLTLCAALALIAATVVVLPAHAARMSDASSSSQSAKARKTTRQFTGVVIEMDETSLTVEKGVKKIRTMVFTRHPEMRTVGTIEEGVRVTVYYRVDGRDHVAIRVVEKPPKRSSRAR